MGGPFHCATDLFRYRHPISLLRGDREEESKLGITSVTHHIPTTVDLVTSPYRGGLTDSDQMVDIHLRVRAIGFVD